VREDLADTSRRGCEVVRRTPEEINSTESKIRVGIFIGNGPPTIPIGSFNLENPIKCYR
jgi:hypothetical protein